MIVLVTGGAASGKSEYAETLTLALGPGERAYFATMQAGDAESRARVQRHRLMRRGKGFRTVECPLSLPEDLSELRCDAALLECMSNFLANVMFSSGKSGEAAAAFILSEMDRLFSAAGSVVVVTNEVFSDGGEYDAFTRAYIAALGAINRAIAARADRVVEVVCGIPLILKKE